MATGAAHTVLIDEPDNFVGLPELQPWLVSLMELLGHDKQAILISHHPEILNTAGAQSCRFLWRDDHTSPTRMAPVRTVEGISLSEAVARGWAHA
jgi:predicted ATPase